MATKYRVIKVKGAEPESFIVLGIDFTDHIIKSTSPSMSEPELAGTPSPGGRDGRGSRRLD